MSARSKKQNSTFKILLDYGVAITATLGMLYWEPSLYSTFWYRRLFVSLAGLLAVVSLVMCYREHVRTVLRNKWLLVLITLTIICLSLSTPATWLFAGHPMVHPSLSSFLASIAVGIWVSAQNLTKILRFVYIGITGFSFVLLGHWAINDTSRRLGYLDTQVIYAACLLAANILIGVWHYRQRTFNTWFMRVSLVILVVCLLLTQTRSALVILGICLLISEHNRLGRRHYILGIVSLLAILSTFGLYFSRLHDSGYLVRSVRYRSSLAVASLPADKKGLLLGEGIGSVERNITINGLLQPELVADIQAGIRFESSHNYAVDILVERGLLVLLLFVSYVVGVVRLYPHDDVHRLARALVIFLTGYLLVNNASMQMELMLWASMLVCVYKGSKNRTIKRHLE